LRFYTLPPRAVAYPFILINANRWREGYNYIREHRKQIQSVILDSGIEIFRDPNIKDYPAGHLHKLVRIYDLITRYVRTGEVYVTCPDYPDDYNPGSLWLSETVTNIERTIQSIEKCVTKFPNVNWLIPIQGHNRKPKSLAKSITLLDELGILDKYDFYAIANICVERRHAIMLKAINIVKLLLPNKRIHVFGLDLDVARKVRNKIFSFDSLAWTFPRQRGKGMCTNNTSRIKYFKEFLTRLD